MRTPSMLRNPAATAIAGAAVATLAVGGVTAVQAATAPKPVKACADAKQALRLSVKGKCPKGTHAVTIAARGPQGLQGVPGNTGASGATGATGPSTTYLSRAPISGTYLPGDTGAADANLIKPVAVVTVDPGSYLINLSIEAKQGTGSAPNGEHVLCTVTQTNTSSGGTVQGTSLPASDPSTYFQGGYGHIAYSFGQTLTATTTLTLACEDVGNNAASTVGYTKVETAELRATAVGKIVDQTPAS